MQSVCLQFPIQVYHRRKMDKSPSSWINVHSVYSGFWPKAELITARVQAHSSSAYRLEAVIGSDRVLRTAYDPEQKSDFPTVRGEPKETMEFHSVLLTLFMVLALS